MKGEASSTSKVPFIDALRGYAIVLVIASC